MILSAHARSDGFISISGLGEFQRLDCRRAADVPKCVRNLPHSLITICESEGDQRQGNMTKPTLREGFKGLFVDPRLSGIFQHRGQPGDIHARIAQAGFGLAVNRLSLSGRQVPSREDP